MDILEMFLAHRMSLYAREVLFVEDACENSSGHN